MSITDKLNDLKIAKQDIKSAIQEKGVTPTGGLSTYADAIRDIQTGGGGGTATLPIGMKFGYSTFTKAPGFDSSGFTDMSNMFIYCQNLVTVPLYDTNKVTNMESMFDNCDNLVTVPLYDTSKVTNMRRMFRGCDKLETIPLFDTSNVTNMMGMFQGCNKLETIPRLDTSKCESFSFMFDGCYNLKTVPKIRIEADFSSGGGPLTNAMFRDCYNLETIEFDVHGPLQFCDEMFYNCSKLKTLGKFRIFESTYFPAKTFYGCTKLTNVGGFEDLKTGPLDLRYSPLLTYESLSNIIGSLKIPQSKVQTIILHPDAAARLTDDLIKRATDKYWTITS